MPTAEASKTPSVVQNRQSPLLTFSLGVSLAVTVVLFGWLMPEFYDWSESDQSRLAPVVLWIAGGILAFDIGLFVLLLGLHFRSARKSGDPLFRFRVRHLLMLVTFMAVSLVVGRQSMLVGSILIFGGTLVGLLWMCLRRPSTCLWVGLILCVQIAPFAWVFRGAFNNGETATLIAMLPTLPLLFPCGLLANWFKIDMRSFEGWSYLSWWTVAQLWCGVFTSRIGWKSLAIFLTLTATCGVFGSFILHALMRA